MKIIKIIKICLLKRFFRIIKKSQSALKRAAEVLDTPALYSDFAWKGQLKLPC